MQTIIAQFANISEARVAVAALLERNYDREDISFVGKDVPATTVRDEGTLKVAAEATLGVLVGVGSLMIPFVGLVLAAGPIGVGLSKAASGVTEEDGHWLGDALVEYGVPAQAARRYGDEIQRGGAIVLMGSRDELTDNITAILRDAGAFAVDFHTRDPKSSGA